MSTTRERYLEWKNRCLLPQLPIEIWPHIFSYLHVNDLFALRLVSRLFVACVNQHTTFWWSVIFDIDQCSIYSVTASMLQHIRSSNINLLTKSNIYSHCTVYLKAQPLVNSTTKRRKRRLLIFGDHQETSVEQPSLRCTSVHIQSLRLFDQVQLEHLLQRRIRRLEFSYECLSSEPSLIFLLKLQHLKYLKISFVHNIIELDPFAVMLCNTMRDIVLLLFKLKRLKSLALRNLHLIQSFPENNVYAIERLRTVCFEDCLNVHHLLSTIDQQHLRKVIIRRSTCDPSILTTFFAQLETLRYLDLSSLEIIRSTNPSQQQLQVSSTLKTCSLNGAFLQYYSFPSSQSSLRSLELTDVTLEQLSDILSACSAVKLLCLFFTTPQVSSLRNMIEYLQQSRYRQVFIHLHRPYGDEETLVLPPNILTIPSRDSSVCFRY